MLVSYMVDISEEWQWFNLTSCLQDKVYFNAGDYLIMIDVDVSSSPNFKSI